MTDDMTRLIEDFKSKVNALPPADKAAVLDAIDDWLGDELNETDPDEADDDDWDEDGGTD